MRVVVYGVGREVKAAGREKLLPKQRLAASLLQLPVCGKHTYFVQLCCTIIILYRGSQ
jgi:hypothetical protein